MRPIDDILHEIKGDYFGHFLIFFEGYAHEIFHGGDLCDRVLSLEKICNRLPGLYASVIQKETPSPLPVGCLTDGLTKLSQQHCVVVASCYGLVLLLST